MTKFVELFRDEGETSDVPGEMVDRTGGGEDDAAAGGEGEADPRVGLRSNQFTDCFSLLPDA
jgi:hypothetical protein